MCFFDQHKFQCGDWKWGHFRVHCQKEFRMGETCGMKLINATIPVAQKCRICEKIDTKERRRAQEMQRLERWQREGGKMRASMEKAMSDIRNLEIEISSLHQQRTQRSQTIGSRP